MDGGRRTNSTRLGGIDRGTWSRHPLASGRCNTHFAVHVNPTNGAIDLNTIGWILMGVGALSIVLSLVFWSSWAGPGRFSRRTTDVGPTGETSTTTIDQR